MKATAMSSLSPNAVFPVTMFVNFPFPDGFSTSCILRSCALNSSICSCMIPSVIACADAAHCEIPDARGSSVCDLDTDARFSARMMRP